MLPWLVSSKKEQVESGVFDNISDGAGYYPSRQLQTFRRLAGSGGNPLSSSLSVYRQAGHRTMKNSEINDWWLIGRQAIYHAKHGDVGEEPLNKKMIGL
ncbi:MAG: hypothetical protein OEL83_01615 [Desulforhopalus sp.]|nr:hypothetical protein [Desulforhopalus sp.]